MASERNRDRDKGRGMTYDLSSHFIQLRNMWEKSVGEKGGEKGERKGGEGGEKRGREGGREGWGREGGEKIGGKSFCFNKKPKRKILFIPLFNLSLKPFKELMQFWLTFPIQKIKFKRHERCLEKGPPKVIENSN